MANSLSQTLANIAAIRSSPSRPTDPASKQIAEMGQRLVEQEARRKLEERALAAFAALSPDAVKH